MLAVSDITMKKLLLLFLIILCYGCGEKPDESIDFLEPQPLTAEDSKSFNKKYQGTYVNPKDKSELIISSSRIIKIRNLPLVFSRNDLDSTFKGNKDDDKQIESSLAEDNIKLINIEGDSIYCLWAIKDTIFEISDRNLLKLFKGSYFNVVYLSYYYKGL